MVRVAAGLAATGLEIGQDMLATVASIPINVGSQSAQRFMHMQQGLAELAVKGDALIEAFFPEPVEELAAWASFEDDDEIVIRLDDETVGSPDTGAFEVETDAFEPSTGAFEPSIASGADTAPSGKYLLYSDASAAAARQASTGPVIDGFEYDDLTLAQLRARLTSFSAEDLAELLSYEEANKARASYLTLLENRISRLTSRA